MAGVDEPPVASCPRVAAYEEHTHGERSDALEQLGSLVSATTAEMLDLITAADRQGDWRVDGATSMATWLVAMLHVSLSTAREWVRVGGALDRLPALRDAFASGMLSWDQVRPATTFVEPPMDDDYARELPGLTVAQIEEMARSHKARTKQDECRAKDERHLSWRTDHQAGGCRYSGFLPADQAAVVNASLERHAETVGSNPETGVWDPFGVRCADALVELAAQHLAEDPGPDPTMVVVHVDSDVVDGTTDGNGSIDGVAISHESVLRLLCDTKIEFNIDGPDGTCIGIGRASKVPPRWLRRRVIRRDVTCRFPGCCRRIRQVHHIQHWTKDGPTDSWNLLGLCWAHHHLVHEGGWTITGSGDGELTFTSPYGRTLSSKPRPLRPSTRARAERAAGVHLGEPPGPPG